MTIDDKYNYLEYQFDPTQISISIKQISLFYLLRRLDQRTINFDTEYQRKAGLWTIKKQSRLIESLILRIPIPTFYFDVADDNNWQVVDGLQRMFTFDNYIIKGKFKLEGLEFIQELNGLNFKDLPRELQRRIDETNITVNLIEKGTPEQVKFVIFDRINTGGVKLNAQELRHALNHGQPANFIEMLSKEGNFLKATSNSIKSVRMQDRELINRFIGFYKNSENYNGNLNAFMNKAMHDLKYSSSEELENIKQDFNKAMELAYVIFGNEAFRIPGSPGKRNNINRAIFDSLSVSLGKWQIGAFDFDGNGIRNFRNSFYQLLNDKDFGDAISKNTNSKKNVVYRLNKVDELVKKYLV